MVMSMIHQQLASGRWHTLDLVEQLANIASEFHRVVVFQNRNKTAQAAASIKRLNELVILTLDDRRLSPERKREIQLLQNVLTTVIEKQGTLKVSTADVENYLSPFTLVFARKCGKI